MGKKARRQEVDLTERLLHVQSIEHVHALLEIHRFTKKVNKAVAKACDHLQMRGSIEGAEVIIVAEQSHEVIVKFDDEGAYTASIITDTSRFAAWVWDDAVAIIPELYSLAVMLDDEIEDVTGVWVTISAKTLFTNAPSGMVEGGNFEIDWIQPLLDWLGFLGTFDEEGDIDDSERWVRDS